jgi:hypothetical protein
LLLIALNCTTSLFGQVNFHFGFENYRLNEKISFQNSENRCADKVGISYSFAVSDNVLISAGILKSDRISDINFDFATAKIYEPTVSIPILFNYKINLSEKTAMLIALGPALSTTLKQEILFDDNATLSTNIKTQYGFGGNYKFGLCGRFGISQKISDRVSLFASATGLQEFETASIKESDRPAFFYKSIGWESGFRFNFK